MTKDKKRELRKRFIDVIFGMIVGLALAADIAFGRSIDVSKAGVSLWIFVCVGAFIILLQIIPAFILFTTFVVGVHKSIKVNNEIQVRQVVKEKIEE